jgi:hypothetical protein
MFKIKNSFKNLSKTRNKNILDWNPKYNSNLRDGKDNSNFLNNNLNTREKFIYIMDDRYSIKPKKEIRLIKEKYLISSNRSIYRKEIKLYEKVNYFNLHDIKTFFKRHIVNIFLPRDYPNSVNDGYYYFSKYSFLSSISFHIMNFISTQVLINSLGLTASRSASLGLSAGLNWVIKDSVGQFATIIFSTVFSRSIELNLKQWRIICTWMYNVGILLDIFTLLKPQYFILIASTSTICKLVLIYD